MASEEESAGLSHEITTKFIGADAARLLWQHIGDNPAEAVIAQFKERFDRLEQGVARMLAVQDEILQVLRAQNQSTQRIETMTAQLASAWNDQNGAERPANMNGAQEGPRLFSRAQLNTIAAVVVGSGLLGAGYLAYALLFA
jgi:hypothetical protein